MPEPGFGADRPARSISEAWYRLGSDDALARLGSSREGLAEEEAARRLAAHGPNALAETRGASPVKVFLHQFASPLIYLLLGAAATSAFLGQYKDAAVIGAVLLINAVIGFVQEHRAERSVRALGRMLVPLARVRRGGREADVESSRLVPGDIVLLASGTLYAFRSALDAGAGIDEARTVGLTTLVFFQLVNARSLTRSAFNVAPLSNPFLLASMGAALLLQLAVLYVPALEWVLGTVPLGPAALGRAALTAAAVFAAVEIDKFFARTGAR